MMLYLGIIIDEVQLHIRQQAGTVVDLVHSIGESSGYRPTLKRKKRYKPSRSFSFDQKPEKISNINTLIPLQAKQVGR